MIGDQRGQHQDADLLEFLVERQRLERQAQIRKVLFQRHRRLHQPAGFRHSMIFTMIVPYGRDAR